MWGEVKVKIKAAGINQVQTVSHLRHSWTEKNLLILEKHSISNNYPVKTTSIKTFPHQLLFKITLIIHRLPDFWEAMLTEADQWLTGAYLTINVELKVTVHTWIFNLLQHAD